ncbi:unnamed protein product [Cylindrotheca closterium]|uniref:Peptidase S1 domain-containing protein n=1 Tax=Cylindrotheca closterium TaxID=2856 RepID=A0AAD2FN17_9STRA|nr:unnamed protein product [Cylindrotheca closterium]
MKILSPLLVLGSLAASVEAKQARIIGGQDADRFGFPHLVYLARDNGKLICTGSLVSQSLVLTSAHCRWPGIERVQIGRWDTSDSTEAYEERTVVAEHLHPEWDDEFLTNDIVLLELDSPVVGVPVVKIAKDESALVPGKPIVAVGYGVDDSGELPDKVQVVELDYVPNEACMGFRGTTTQDDGTLREVPYSSILQSDHMCTHFSDGIPRDFCKGDSGGPLLIRNSKWRVPLTPTNTRYSQAQLQGPQFIKSRQEPTEADHTYTQIGIASLGFDCADANAPGIGQRIAESYDFIRSTICRIDGESTPADYNCGDFFDFGQYPGTGVCDGAAGPNSCTIRSDCNTAVGECCMYDSCTCTVPEGSERFMCVPNKA